MSSLSVLFSWPVTFGTRRRKPTDESNMTDMFFSCPSSILQRSKSLLEIDKRLSGVCTYQTISHFRVFKRKCLNPAQWIGFFRVVPKIRSCRRQNVWFFKRHHVAKQRWLNEMIDEMFRTRARASAGSCNRSITQLGCTYILSHLSFLLSS